MRSYRDVLKFFLDHEEGLRRIRARSNSILVQAVREEKAKPAEPAMSARKKKVLAFLHHRLQLGSEMLSFLAALLEDSLATAGVLRQRQIRAMLLHA